MKIINIPLLEIDLSDFMKRRAKESDCSNFINYDCLIKVNGVPKVLYLKLNEETKYLLQSCKNIKYSNVERISSGLITKGKNRTFGLRPKRLMSQFASSCSATSLATESKVEHSILCGFVKKLIPYYEKFFNSEYIKNQIEVNKKILPEWRIGDTPFTSGIVNYNSELQYHYDIGHIPECFSIMVVLKKGMNGGGLCFPELGVNIELANNTIILMDGQELMHGVTPMRKFKSNAYRYTIVYYSLLQMWKCLPIDQEVIATRKMRAQREFRRANGEISKMNSDIKSNGKRFVERSTKSLSKKKLSPHAKN